jgi:hypothetical protein
VGSVSKNGSWGWKTAESSNCDSGSIFLTSARLRSEHEQGDGDDTGTNSVQMKCGNGEERKSGFEGYWGSWGSYKSCPPGNAINGINVQIESNQGDGDDTSVNGIQFSCIPVR